MLIIGLIGGSPIILKRISNEENNNTYEVAIVAYSAGGLSLEYREELYKDVSKNISSIVFDNLSIDLISYYRNIEYMTVSDYKTHYKDDIEDLNLDDANNSHTIIKLDKTYIDKLIDKGLDIITTEFNSISGASEYLNNNASHVIRGHEIRVDQLGLTQQELSERIERAVKERNIRFISIRNFLDYEDYESTEDIVNKGKKLLNKKIMQAL